MNKSLRARGRMTVASAAAAAMVLAIAWAADPGVATALAQNGPMRTPNAPFPVINPAPAPAPSQPRPKGLKPEDYPEAPFVADAPADGGWRIAMTYKRAIAEPVKESPQHAQWQQMQKNMLIISEITVSKAGDTRRVIIHYTQGKQDEQYITQGMSFEQRATLAAGDIYISTVLTPPAAVAKASKDFPELAWLSGDNFTGIQDFKVKRCQVFKVKEDNIEREAWIDVTTKWPVKLSDSGYDRVYTISNTPPESAQPSALIAKKVVLYFGTMK